MSRISILSAIANLQNELIMCEKFHDFDGCERIEQEISELESLLEETR